MYGSRISWALAAVCVTCAFSQDVKNKAEGKVHRASRSAELKDAATAPRVARPARQFSLGRLRPSESRPVRRKPGLAPIGVSRALPAELKDTGDWSATPDGKTIWRVSVRSEGATALRVRFADFHVGDGKVWVVATDADGAQVSAGPYTGDGPYGDGTFWSDILASDSVIVTYEPTSVDATSLPGIPFTLAEISHRFAPMSAAAPAPADLKGGVVQRSASASCTVEIACRPEYSEPASAVALMVFESEGESYQCSGSLLSSASQPAKPFFLTANHCVSTAAEAKSLITFFNYQTASCSGAAPVLNRSPRVTGATLLATGGMSLGDYTLLQLSGFPSIDVKLLGWTSNAIAANEKVISISHPAGDSKRVALGERTRDATIRFSDGDRMPASRGYQVTWFEGVTQGGSSGSPLFAEIDGKPYVIGTLTGGPDIDEENDAQVCRTNNLIASFGRFSTAFPDFQPYLTTIDGGAGVRPAGAAPTFTASPLTSAAPVGVTTLTWDAPGVSRVQIRVGSPDGVPMTGIESPAGTAQTGDWASEGMTFYLQDASSGNSSGQARTLATVRVQRSGSTAQRAGIISLTPSRIVAPPGQSTASATITWRALGVSRVQIRVGSASGTPVTGLEVLQGSSTTGNWITNGTTFFLQDASSGDSAGSAKTLAFVRAEVVAR